MKLLTEDTLFIFWPTQKYGEGGKITTFHEEKKGILIYGLWERKKFKKIDFPSNIWPLNVKAVASYLKGENWVVLLWTIHFEQWPNPNLWQALLEKSLRVMLSSGAFIAWCGREGFFVDPPDLFDPQFMEGSVYAVLAQDKFECSALLGSLYQPIDNKLLSDLHKKIQKLLVRRPHC